MKERCNKCKWWKDWGPNLIGYGACYRFPPTVIKLAIQSPDGMTISQYPMTYGPGDYCGEFKPIRKVKKACT